MKKFHIAILFIALFGNVLSIFGGGTSREVRIDLTDQNKVFETDFGNNMVLRIIKDSSVKHRDFGWILEVGYKPYGRNFRNLIYTNPTGTTADRSQVYAWHVAGGEFPNYRVLLVKGQLEKIRIDLINPKTEGHGEDARFISGKLKISWGR